MNTFILIDSANLFSRAKYAVRGDISIKTGMCLHVMFNSIKKVWNKFNGSHLVFCFEGRSWRKDYYQQYKENRIQMRNQLSASEQEEEKLFWEVFDEFKTFVETQTNCTVLQHKNLEADDLIAGFVQSHPNDNHVIISTDTDFYQLIAENVSHYNGVTEVLTTWENTYNAKDQPAINNKTKLPIGAPNPEWILFEKCIRGDKSDFVFSAYPGVRLKGTKNKVGIIEAFEDRNNKGWAWNNFMMSRWIDHNQQEHKVLDDYLRNKVLIDLTLQPEDIREKINNTISEATNNLKNISQVGVKLMKFCNAHDLQNVLKYIESYAYAYQARYPC